MGINTKMRKKKTTKALTNFFVWLLGLLVSLAVGFGMISGTLVIKWIPAMVTVVAGWAVVIMALLGVLMKVVGALD